MSRKITADALGFLTVTENCFYKRGKLIPAYAVADCDGRFPDGAEKILYSPAVKRYFAVSEDAVSVSGDGVNFVRIFGFGSKFPFLAEDYTGDIPRAFVVCGRNAVVYNGVSHTSAELGVRAGCGVMHCGRLFCADADNGLRLCWSGTGGVTDAAEGLAESGFLHLCAERGEILSLLPFGEKIVAVRKYGITVLNMQSAPEKFSVDFTDTACAEVIKNTACTVSGKLYFFNGTGFKVFDGKSISPFEFRLADRISAPRFAIAYDNKIFISCDRREGGADAVCIEPESGESCFLGVQAESALSDGGLIFIKGAEKKKLVSADSFAFETSFVDFGTGRDKTLTEIYCDGACVMEVCDGRRMRKFVLSGGTIRPKMRGKKFKIKVSGREAISKIVMTAEVENAV